MFKMLGALFASMFASKAGRAPAVPPRNLGPVDARRHDAEAPAEKTAGFGRMVFPPMRFHRAIRNPEARSRKELKRDRNSANDAPHYIEQPHPVVLPPAQRMSRIGKALDDVAKGKETPRLRGKALKRRVRDLQFAASCVANRIATHEKLVARRAA